MQQMVGDSKCRSRPYYFRRCKKERPIPTSIDSLPDELLFLILVCLPADYLHDKARFVCRRWYDIIHSQSFINAHHHQCTTYCPLVFYDSYKASVRQIYMMTATSQGIIQTNELSYIFRGRYSGTCNGLILERLPCEINTIVLQIINPATKQKLVLPPFTAPVGIAMNTTFASIAYAAASMKYKVAISYRTSSSSKIRCLAILSVGVDNSWRQVRVDHLSKHDWDIHTFLRTGALLASTPLITLGFMHWVDHLKGKTVLTLDVETEIFTVSFTVSPVSHEDSSNPKYFFSTGRSLSMLIGQRGLYGEYMRFFELWEMNPETKEWIKLVDDIKLGDQQQQLRLQQLGIRPLAHLRPCGWLKYPEVLVFCVYDTHEITSSTRFRTVISYNLDTHEISSTNFPILYYTLALYQNSLLWLT